MIQILSYGLTCHPASASEAIDRIEVRIERPATSTLVIAYTLIRRIADIVLPAPVATTRCNGLWKTTCFEAFFRSANATAYTEHNFAPSTAWAAYAFDAYRLGMRDLVTAAPFMEREASSNGFTLSVSLPIDPRFASTTVMMGLSAVVEARDGTKSYWALAHPPGAPDFHHADCFAAELASSRSA